MYQEFNKTLLLSYIMKNKIIMKLFYLIIALTLFIMYTGCIDSVEKHPVSMGSRVVCRINDLKCTACAECIDKCPEMAIYEIELNEGWIVYIDLDKCSGCFECMSVCEYKSIEKVEY